ncbi:MAG: hypothetical protein QM778_26950 [Myxococcales bacterium]
MRIDLERLALHGLALDLAREGHPSDRVSVRSADGISGKMFSDSRGFELEGVRAPSLQLDLLQLTFGSLTLLSKGETVFDGLQAALGTRSGQLEGRVATERTRAVELSVQIGKLHISALLEADQLVLELKGSAGSVQADVAVFRNLVVESAGALRVAVPELRAEALHIGWGDPEFKLSFGQLRAPELELTQANVQLRGSAVALEQGSYQAGSIQARRAKLERVEGNLSLPPAPKPPEPRQSRPPEPRQSRAPGAPSTNPLWDRSLLDRVSGNLNVDVEVDLAVPIIGRRRATHEIRVPIADGSLDYLVLESGLSRLEDSLLDFAVREGALVLEVGIPLVGVRGRGKPLVIWDLTPEDYRLAERNRVRLAVLPQARLSSPRQSEPPPEPSANGGSGPRFALRHMTLANIDTDFSLAPQARPMNAALRELVLGSLRVQGTVHHDPESAPRAGLLRVDGDKLTASVHAMPLGSSVLTSSAHLTRLEDATLRFEDTRLAQVTLVLTTLELDGLDFGPAQAPGLA